MMMSACSGANATLYSSPWSSWLRTISPFDAFTEIATILFSIVPPAVLLRLWWKPVPLDQLCDGAPSLPWRQRLEENRYLFEWPHEPCGDSHGLDGLGH